MLKLYFKKIIGAKRVFLPKLVTLIMAKSKIMTRDSGNDPFSSLLPRFKREKRPSACARVFQFVCRALLFVNPEGMREGEGVEGVEGGGGALPWVGHRVFLSIYVPVLIFFHWTTWWHGSETDHVWKSEQARFCQNENFIIYISYELIAIITILMIIAMKMTKFILTVKLVKNN